MPHHVYVIGSPDAPLSKIGVTDHVPRRLRQIQNMSPVPLQVLWETPGDHRLEKALHRYFREARQHGEWFLLDDPVARVREALMDPKLFSLASIPSPKRTGWKQPERITGEAVRVYEGLLSRLDSGEFPVGVALPRTAEIAAHYGVSVIVAVKAVKHLHVQGRIVWPRHGRATICTPEPGPTKTG